jgi:two-component system sensor histidine kinase KdpD
MDRCLRAGPAASSIAATDRDRLVQTLRLAEQLGAETVTLTGERVAQELLNYARSRNATKLIVGKPVRSLWKEWLFGSVVSELVHQSGGIDIYVITGEAGEGHPLIRRSLKRTSNRREYLYALVGVAIATAVAWAMFPYFGPANLIMMYLMAVIVIAIRLGRGPSVLASFVSVATFDFFFVPPYLSFAVSDIQYVLTFAIMLIVALVISNLAVRIREQAELARDRERRTAVLYSMSRDLATHRGTAMLAQVASKHLREVFDGQVAIFLADVEKRVRLQRGEQLFFDLDPKEAGVAQWVFDHNERAGSGADTLPGASALYLPLVGSTDRSESWRSGRTRGCYWIEQLHLLESLINQVALAIERTRLSDGATGSRASGNGTHAQCHFEFSLSRLADTTGHHYGSSQQLVGRTEPPQCERSPRALSIDLPRGEPIGSAAQELTGHDADRGGGCADQQSGIHWTRLSEPRCRGWKSG